MPCMQSTGKVHRRRSRAWVGNLGIKFRPSIHRELRRSSQFNYDALNIFKESDALLGIEINLVGQFLLHILWIKSAKLILGPARAEA